MKKNFLDYAEEYSCMGILAFMTVLIFAQVVMRYVFSYSLPWCEELSRYLFIWLSWIGASYCVKIDAHLSVTVLTNFLSKKVLPYFNMFMYLCWGIFAVLLAFQGLKLVMMIIDRGQTSPAMQMPLWLPVASVPVGSALMTVRIIGKMRETLRRIRNPEEVV